MSSTRHPIGRKVSQSVSVCNIIPDKHTYTLKTFLLHDIPLDGKYLSQCLKVTYKQTNTPTHRKHVFHTTSHWTESISSSVSRQHKTRQTHLHIENMSSTRHPIGRKVSQSVSVGNIKPHKHTYTLKTCLPHDIPLDGKYLSQCL